MSYRNFHIQSPGQISQEFIRRDIRTFHDAMSFIKGLPYRRNLHKENPVAVFSDGYGTCSTKHAVLKQLAIENDIGDVKLGLGIFRMNRDNTPYIRGILDNANLSYIPEAHCYLRIGNEIADCTSASFTIDFSNDLLTEIEIEPFQIKSFKEEYHKRALADWLAENPHIPYSLNTLFSIREQCIKALELRAEQKDNSGPAW